jgi:threonine/homoserine/homoserine lactone efflux protein
MILPALIDSSHGIWWLLASIGGLIFLVWLGFALWHQEVEEPRRRQKAAEAESQSEREGELEREAYEAGFAAGRGQGQESESEPPKETPPTPPAEGWDLRR